MVAPYVVGVPGVRDKKRATNRQVFVSAEWGLLPHSLIIDGTKSRDPGNGVVTRLRPGLMMGKITSSGKYAPSTMGVLAALHDTSVATTTLTLPAASVTEIQRRIGASGTLKLIGPETAGGTVNEEEITYSAVASSTTLTITQSTNDFIAGSIIAPDDGSETPLCFIFDGTGIKVVDDDGTGLDVGFEEFPISGVVDYDQLIDASSDASIKAWIKAALSSSALGKFVFSDGY